MIANIGYAAVFIAFVAAIYAAVASYYGAKKNKTPWVESARNANQAIFVLLLAACALLITLLLLNDYSVEYVWRVSSREMPTYLKVTSLWGGQAGSLLFWNLLLAGFTALALSRKWNEQRKIIGFSIFVASLTQIFFLSLIIFAENPFARLEF